MSNTLKICTSKEHILGALFRMERKALGLNQTQLAEMIGITTSTYCRYEEAGCTVSVSAVWRLEHIFNGKEGLFPRVEKAAALLAGKGVQVLPQEETDGPDCLLVKGKALRAMLASSDS